MWYNSTCHTTRNGALFVSSADVFNNTFYWVKHPVLSDFRPAGCVTTSADSTGCFVMKAIDRFFQKVEVIENGCWQWNAATRKNGYSVFHVNRKTAYGHRYAYQEMVGQIPPGMDLDHLCRNRACVNPAHLEAVTRKINLQRGKTGKTKFKAEDIKRIRSLYASGNYSQYTLAKMFNTNQGYITHIVNRNVWEHV